MTKDEILEKVKQREYEKRCVDANVCPTCGLNLGYDDDNNKVCRRCNLSFPFMVRGAQ